MPMRREHDKGKHKRVDAMTGQVQLSPFKQSKQATGYRHPMSLVDRAICLGDY